MLVLELVVDRDNRAQNAIGACCRLAAQADIIAGVLNRNGLKAGYGTGRGKNSLGCRLFVFSGASGVDAAFINQKSHLVIHCRIVGAANQCCRLTFLSHKACKISRWR